MASRPPENGPPANPPSDALARNRWLVINLQRVIGVGMILFGILVVRGIVDLPQVAAYVFIAVGLIDVFLVPTILARRWRSPRQ